MTFKMDFIGILNFKIFHDWHRNIVVIVWKFLSAYSLYYSTTILNVVVVCLIFNKKAELRTVIMFEVL